MSIWAVLSGVLAYEVIGEPRFQQAIAGAVSGLIVASPFRGAEEIANGVRLNRSALEISRGDLSSLPASGPRSWARTR